MTLELNKVAEQMGEIGRDLADGAERRRQVLPALRELRRLYAHDRERLAALASSPAGREARCALPTREPLDATFPAPEPPDRATILAADGSQIYPDPHGWALYYLINVGSLVYRHGSGQAPEAASAPQVAQAVDAEGNLLAGERIDARRDVAEVQRLAELCEGEAGGEPLVALLDSTLGLRAWSATIPQAEQAALQQSYDAQVARIRGAGAALAGFLSRSRQAGAVSLLNLAKIDELVRQGNPSDVSVILSRSEAQRSGGKESLSWREDLVAPYKGDSSLPSVAQNDKLVQGLTDQMLWGDLLPGERSALFVEAVDPPVYFFYLNTDPRDAPRLPGVEAEPARIELPEWVALSPEKLTWVHALVYDQCCINNGYPYALTRADELAIIFNDEREALEAMLLQAISRQGLPLPRPSPKERQKRRARPRHRRRR